MEEVKFIIIIDYFSFLLATYTDFVVVIHVSGVILSLNCGH
jgi:hypothetical protein